MIRHGTAARTVFWSVPRPARFGGGCPRLLPGADGFSHGQPSRRRFRRLPAALCRVPRPGLPAAGSLSQPPLRRISPAARRTRRTMA